MTPELAQVDTVVTGRWNPHIIQPPWIFQQKLVDVDEQPDVELGVSAGHGIAFRFQLGGYIWAVDFDRLVIQDTHGRNTAELAARVLAKLSHTPVTGVGNNFRYTHKASENTWSPLLRHLANHAELAKQGTVAKASLACSLDVNSLDVKSGLTVNVSLENCPPNIQLSLNFHRPIKSATEVGKAAKSFETDKATSSAIATALLREGGA